MNKGKAGIIAACLLVGGLAFTGQHAPEATWGVPAAHAEPPVAKKIIYLQLLSPAPAPEVVQAVEAGLREIGRAHV